MCISGTFAHVDLIWRISPKSTSTRLVILLYSASSSLSSTFLGSGTSENVRSPASLGNTQSDIASAEFIFSIIKRMLLFFLAYSADFSDLLVKSHLLPVSFSVV
jgi:hypothetical protein